MLASSLRLGQGLQGSQQRQACARRSARVHANSLVLGAMPHPTACSHTPQTEVGTWTTSRK